MASRKTVSKRKIKKAVRTANKLSPGGILLLLLLIAAVGVGYYFYLQMQTPEDSEPQVEIDGTLSVHFIDVGQGDSQLIVTSEGDTLLIDAGPNSCEESLLSYLDSYRITTLDYVIFTHFDEDHIGGGDAVLDAMEKVGKVYTPDYTPTTVNGQKLMNSIEACGAELIHPEQGDVLTLDGGVKITVLSKDEITDKGSNGDSIVTKISFGSIDFLLTGDADEAEEEDMLEKYKKELDAEVMTACHHGSKYSNTQDFLEAISPEYVVISCGAGNKYGHPHSEALERFTSVCKNIYRTDLSGTILFTSDGETLTTSSEKGVTSLDAPVTYIFLIPHPSELSKKYI